MNQPAIPSTVISQPLVHFGREICGDLACGLRREWLVTNGLGGYASGTLAGVKIKASARIPVEVTSATRVRNKPQRR